MDCFHYPLDTAQLLRKKRRIRRELLAQLPNPLHKNIAILGGSTTNDGDVCICDRGLNCSSTVYSGSCCCNGAVVYGE